MIIAEELKSDRLRLLTTEPAIQPNAMFVAYTRNEVPPSVLAVTNAAEDVLRQSGELRQFPDSFGIT